MTMSVSTMKGMLMSIRLSAIVVVSSGFELFTLHRISMGAALPEVTIGFQIVFKEI
jgi:hypothetical protein